MTVSARQGLDSDQLDQALRRNLDWAAEILQTLIRIPSHRGFERPIQNRIAAEFSERGLIVTEVPIDPKGLAGVPGFSPASVGYESQLNVVGRLPGKGGGKSLALNFHIDTAPPGPEELWEGDPYSGKRIDGKIYGRGSWDDKAGAALSFLVLKTLKDLGIQLRGDLIFQSVVDDENTGNGSLAVVSAGHGADAVVVLDGAYGPHAIVGHPGYSNFRITVYGSPAPSCRTDMGENAIEKIFPILSALRKLQLDLNLSAPDSWKKTGQPVNFNPGVIRGGDWVGSVPAKCEVDCQMSFVPPHTLAEFRGLVAKAVGEAADQDPWLKAHPPRVEFIDLATGPIEIDSNNEFISLLSGNCREIFGQDLNLRIVTGWCDLRHFSLFKPTPCCLFGPGKGVNAHKPNEYFEVEEFIPHAKVLLLQIASWCEIANGEGRS